MQSLSPSSNIGAFCNSAYAQKAKVTIMSTMQLKNDPVGVLRVKLHLTIEENLRGIKYAYKTIKTFQGLAQSDAQLMAEEFQRLNKGLTFVFEWQAYSVSLYTESAL